jgi:hypothetical protein
MTAPLRELRNDLRAEQLRRALEPYLFDGTEAHRVIDAELRGLEHEIAASAIRHAVLSQFRNTIPFDVVIEIVGKLFEDGELA